ncbi:hypothetical protein GGI25_004576 [Coemansia spiralis]|uniref:Phosphoribulokinase/uridine kinase domain-containing protein n=2 Tax=Coemansia TaxID=4863 RepID=A0A9W8G6D2_9FUNG|nr:P-loop containing nucleoside triphosphate hydrolase protein [Coemansia spiralis]KAJ1989921.1 hypothetical protein EDC05_004355 [Coemansia umbellata]KAJ2620634.1 hypothetical protein GGI26_004796 [Coemansia sp. RSA 1358]KAJ2673829.1 hypothetical protein GGI25_004576 [Coemansia spiralis]
MVAGNLIGELVDYLLQKASSGRRFIVAIAGIAGSGKSYLSEHISSAVNVRYGAEVSIVLPMDGFHLTKAQLASMDDPEVAFARRGAPWTFDAVRFVELVRQVRSNSVDDSVVWWPSFDHAAGDPVEGMIAVRASHRVVLIEGLYAHVNSEPWAAVGGELADELWWVSPRSRDISRERLVQRHIATGLAHNRDEAAQRIADNDSINGEFAESRRHRPTRVIDN